MVRPSLCKVVAVERIGVQVRGFRKIVRKDARGALVKARGRSDNLALSWMATKVIVGLLEWLFRTLLASVLHCTFVPVKQPEDETEPELSQN